MRFKGLTVAALVVIVAACNTSGTAEDGATVESASSPTAASSLKPYAKLSGSAAKAMYDGLTAQAVSGRKRVAGKGAISCDLLTSPLPPGAQGIAAPMASCVGVPTVNFPAGAQGIVLPWFQMNGFNGYQLYAAMPTSADASGDKNAAGEFDITCKKSGSTYACEIKAKVAAPQASTWFSLEGYAAKETFAKLAVGPTGGVKKLEGTAGVYCEVIVHELPAGAQGISAPMATCTIAPNVEFPAGAQGIILPWLQLDGMAGYEMYGAMPAASVEGMKQYSGHLAIECTKTRCDFRK